MSINFALNYEYKKQAEFIAESHNLEVASCQYALAERVNGKWVGMFGVQYSGKHNVTLSLAEKRDFYDRPPNIIKTIMFSGSSKPILLRKLVSQSCSKDESR